VVDGGGRARMSTSDHPYEGLPNRAFWRSAVATKHFYNLTDVANPFRLGDHDKVATAGSCFAQHIGRQLRQRGMRYLDLEPAPPFLSPGEARRHGFELFSCRFGNIYTARQLLQLAQEALHDRRPRNIVWSRNGRYYDALRPSVDPSGHESDDQVLALRAFHLRKVRELFETVDVFIFTLGLTEAWECSDDGTVYPTAPGISAGRYDPADYGFRNFRHAEILGDLRNFWNLLREVNPTARMLLTVSPVPLTATASSNHVLVATTYSKSTLRAVAGDISDEIPDIGYFPSFEMICTHPSRGMFFNPDMRSVNDAGVDYVMSHFFRASQIESPALGTQAGERAEELICDEQLLDQFGE
jgi:hypothetical protein